MHEILFYTLEIKIHSDIITQLILAQPIMSPTNNIKKVHIKNATQSDLLGVSYHKRYEVL